VYYLCVFVFSVCLYVCIETWGTKRLRISMRSSASQSYIDLCVFVFFFKPTFRLWVSYPSLYSPPFPTCTCMSVCLCMRVVLLLRQCQFACTCVCVSVCVCVCVCLERERGSDDLLCVAWRVCVSVCLCVFRESESGSDDLLCVAWLFFPFYFSLLSCSLCRFALSLLLYCCLSFVGGGLFLYPPFTLSSSVRGSWPLFVLPRRAFFTSPIPRPPTLFFCFFFCRSGLSS
jgi:hypothetical protein